jgi:O-succinylbenzoic acid--CoA ligase
MAAGADDRWLLSLPVFHVGGFGVAARAREAGGESIGMTGRWEPRAFVDLAGESRSTLASLVPTQLHDIVREGLAAPPDLRAVLVGGGRLPAGQARQARGLGWPVVRTYGMTETGSQIATAPIQDRDPDPDAPLQVLGIWDVDLTEDRLLKLRGPALLDSYLHEEGGKVVRNDPKEHGWFTTSDVVRCDHRGLSLLGRADRRVKVLGELVDVSHLEGQLADRWAGECCVAVVPDERRGARLVPVFDGEPVETSRRIVQSLNGELPGFARLEEPCHLHPWPRTAVGKTCYRSVTGKIGAGPSS